MYLILSHYLDSAPLFLYSVAEHFNVPGHTSTDFRVAVHKQTKNFKNLNVNVKLLYTEITHRLDCVLYSFSRDCGFLPHDLDYLLQPLLHSAG